MASSRAGTVARMKADAVGLVAAADPSPTSSPAQPTQPHRPETTRLYAGEWAAFRGWCVGNADRALPADPACVAAYLRESGRGVGPSALGRRVAAINAMHRQHGYAPPGAAPAVKAVLRAARQRRRTGRRMLPPDAARLARMAASCPGDLAGTRDRALLLLAAASGLGRTAMLRLDAEQVRFTGGGAELMFEETGSTRVILLARGASFRVCPVHSLQAWLRASDCRYGPVFRKVDRWGNVEHDRLGADAIRRIWLRRALAGRGKARGPADKR